MQVQAFSDASKRLYAAAVYLHFKIKVWYYTSYSCNKQILNIIYEEECNYSESRIVMCFINDRIRLINTNTFDKLYYLTDSTIVYCWVLNCHKTYVSHVQKRLEKIRSALKRPYDKQLKLVPSKLNPADIGTRGLAPKDLPVSGL